MSKPTVHPWNALNHTDGFFGNGARTIKHLSNKCPILEAQATAKGTAVALSQAVNGFCQQFTPLLSK